MGSELSGKASIERCHLTSSVKVWVEDNDETVSQKRTIAVSVWVYKVIALSEY